MSAMPVPYDPDDPLFLAGVDLLRRTGAVALGVRYSDDDQPIVWMAVASWRTNDDGHPIPAGGEVRHDAAAALTPTRAVLRLCEQALDGGACNHCKRPSGFEPDSLDTMPANRLICWYQYDPELKTFRRGCGGG